MSRQLKTSLTIEAHARGVDKIAAARQELVALGRGAAESSPALAQLQTTLGELAQQQRLIAQFTQLKLAVTASAAEMQKTRQAAGDAARELRAKSQALAAATQAEQAGAAALQQARTHHDALKTAIAQAVAELKQMRAEQRSGAGASAELAAKIKETQAQLGVLRSESQRAGAQVKALAGDQRALVAAVKEAATAHGAAEKAMLRAVGAAQSAKAVFEAQRASLHALRQGLSEVGLSSTQLAEVKRRIAGAVEQARAAYASATEAARAQAAEETRLAQIIEQTKARMARAAQEQLAAERAATAEWEAAQERQRRAAEAAARAIQTAFDSLRMRSAAQIQADIDQVNRALETLRTTGNLSAGELARASERAGARIAELRREMSGLSPASQSMRAGIDSIAASVQRVQQAFIAWQAAKAALLRGRELIEVADNYKGLTAQVALLNRSAEGYNVTLAEMGELARRTFSNINTVTQLAGALARAGSEIGVSQEVVLRLTETINKANQLSGQSAASADAAVVQLIQGLQSGVLRGQEFNSMMLQAPRLAQALADGLGVPRSALRELANEGRLTTDVIIDALQSQARAVDEEFALLPTKVSDALTNLSTSFMEFIGRVDSGAGATAALAELILAVADNLDTVGAIVMTVAQFVAVWIGVKAVAAVQAYAAAQMAATVGATGMATAMSVVAAAARTAWAAMAASPAFIIIGLVELARALDWVISNWRELTEKVRTYFDARKKQQTIEAHTAETQRLIAERLADISRQTGVTVTSMQELDAAVAAGKLHFDEASASWQAGVGTLAQVQQAAGDVARQHREIAKALQEAAGSFGPVAEAAREALAEVEQRLDAAKQAASEAVSDMSTAWQSLSEAVAQEMDAQLAAVQRRYEQERAELENSDASQRTLIAETTRLLVEALAEQSSARATAAAETLRLIDEEGAARKEAAFIQAGTEADGLARMQRVENDMLAARKRTLAEVLAAYREHVDALNGEINRHHAEVQRLENEKKALSQSTEDRIREIRRGTMSEDAALADRRRQVAEKLAAARQALARGEFEEAQALGKQAMELSSQVASSQSKDAQTSAEAKGAVNKAIGDMLAGERLVKEAIDAEARAHKSAAASATEARSEIEGRIAETGNQVNSLAEQLEKGLKLTLEADKTKLDAAIEEVERLMAEKAFMAKIEADLTAAEAQIEAYDALLKAGKELPVDASFDAAEAALARFGEQAKTQGRVKLAIDIDAATASIGNVQAELRKLSDIRTQHQHTVNSNVAQVRSEIQSLNGQNTSSTHTITVVRVEANATGGLAGRSLQPVQRFAQGGPAAPMPMLMTAGAVPGAGDTDSVSRSLPVGAYVIRKMAVQYYGREGLSEIVARAKASAASATQAVASVTQRAGQRVSSLLMPGEHVFAPADVAQLGVRFFDGLNAMSIPPEPSVQRFASGGRVMDNGQAGLLARAREIGGLELEKRIKDRWAAQQHKRRFSGDWRWYLDMLRDTRDELDRMELSKERAERAAAQGESATATNRKWTGQTARDSDDTPARPRSGGRSAGVSPDTPPTARSSGISQSPARTVNMNISLNNKQYAMQNMPEQSAQTLETMLRDLERAAGVAQ